MSDAKAECSRFPRRGFRVIWTDGKPVVVERELIGRNGSWTISRLRDGTAAKENGCSWSDTVIEAIEREAESIMWRFTMPTLFEKNAEYRKMCFLMREAAEWGRLLGEIGAAAVDTPADD